MFPICLICAFVCVCVFVCRWLWVERNGEDGGGEKAREKVNIWLALRTYHNHLTEFISPYVFKFNCNTFLTRHFFFLFLELHTVLKCVYFIHSIFYSLDRSPSVSAVIVVHLSIHSSCKNKLIVTQRLSVSHVLKMKTTCVCTADNSTPCSALPCSALLFFLLIFFPSLPSSVPFLQHTLTHSIKCFFPAPRFTSVDQPTSHRIASSHPHTNTMPYSHCSFYLPPFIHIVIQNNIFSLPQTSHFTVNTNPSYRINIHATSIVVWKQQHQHTLQASRLGPVSAFFCIAKNSLTSSSRYASYLLYLPILSNSTFHFHLPQSSMSYIYTNRCIRLCHTVQFSLGTMTVTEDTLLFIRFLISANMTKTNSPSSLLHPSSSPSSFFSYSYPHSSHHPSFSFSFSFFPRLPHFLSPIPSSNTLFRAHNSKKKKKERILCSPQTHP